MIQKITPFFWFDGQAEEAARFYTSIFKNSKVTQVNRYVEGSHMPVGTAMTVDFELEGQQFVALNGGPEYKFTPAISFYIHCKDQAEVDWFWDRLSEGGRTDQCGWLTDRFGVTWQVVPDVLVELLSSPDANRARRVTEAMLKMTKIDVAALQRAAAG